MTGEWCLCGGVWKLIRKDQRTCSDSKNAVIRFQARYISYFVSPQTRTYLQEKANCEPRIVCIINVHWSMLCIYDHEDERQKEKDNRGSGKWRTSSNWRRFVEFWSACKEKKNQISTTLHCYIKTAFDIPEDERVKTMTNRRKRLQRV